MRSNRLLALSCSLAVLSVGPALAFQDVPEPPGPLARAAAAGDDATKVFLSLPKVTLRVDDGGDLDRYLFRSGGPIDFSIDFKGFQPDLKEMTKLTLSVWDVDEQGASGCPVELDLVRVNGTIVGKLIGENGQTSTPTFEVPRDVFTSGINHIEVEIDSLAEDKECWATRVDWAEVEIPFNIAQVEASAERDVEISGPDGVPLEHPIWRTGFDDQGNVIQPAAVDHSLAAAVKSKTFKYLYTFETWPEGAEPDWSPKVDYTWAIEGSDASGTGSLTGWNNGIDIRVPPRIGKYRLRVDLKLSTENLSFPPERRYHTLYVLWKDPLLVPPKESWLDVATEWGAGGSEEEILTALLTSVHANSYNWEYSPNGGFGLARDLIENKGGSGDCQTFTGVWTGLAEALGLEPQRDDFDPPTGFLTLPGNIAIDKNSSANALNLCTDKRDRWYFGAHAYGYAGGFFYDPTFGLKGPHVAGAGTGNVYCQENATTLECDDPSSHLPVAVLIPYWTPAEILGGWNQVHFQPPGGCPPGSPGGPPQGVRPAAAPQAGAAAARMTGVLLEQPQDFDGNGLFESLRIDLGVEVLQEGGTFVFDATLVDAAGRTIARGAVTPQLPVYTFVSSRELSTGQQAVPLYFEGKAIRASGSDGPYSLRVRLLSEAGDLDTFTSGTRSYRHESFQGALAELRNLSDTALSADTRPGAELLRVKADLNVLGAGEIVVKAQLMAGETWLGHTTLSRRFEPGVHRIDLDFSGPEIFAAGADGPYTVLLSAADPYYVVNARHTTAAYGHGDFQTPDAFLAGARDSGQDTDGDGRFDVLELTADVGALAAGTYTLHGSLEDGAGGFITSARTQASLSPGPPTGVKLAFDGLAIGRHGTAGPYRVELALSGPGGQLMSLDHTTSPYPAGSIARPAAKLTGSIRETPIDADRNSLFERLRLDVGVEAARAGTYAVSGSLNTPDGTFVAAVSQPIPLGAGAQTVSLDFSGAEIRARQTDGPYQLVALELRETGGRLLDNRPEAHTTAAYEWKQFQPSGPELAGASDRGEDTNGNGLYDRLAVTLDLLVLRGGVYSFNARLADRDGQQIGWASGSQSLAAGNQSVTLRFDGRRIYGNGAAGPYSVRDLSFYSGFGMLSLREVHTTSAYDWKAFEPSGVVEGTVKIGDEPLAGAFVVINGVGSDRTDVNGAYRLAVLQSGTYKVELVADPDLAPWDISVNGSSVSEGVSATVQVVLGQTTRVDFSNAVACEIYPIALHRDTLSGAARGQELRDILNGAGTGQFGWLSWTGETSNEALVRSLAPPGNVDVYVNPDAPADRVLSRGDRVAGLPGVRNSSGARDALQALASKVITVPIWEEAEGRGATLRYRITGFAQVQILSFDLSTSNRISVIYRRPVVCRGR